MRRPQRVNILLVDEQAARLVELETVLKPLGQNLVLARSGQEALHLLLRDDFAVILLTLEMAGMDGFETARLLREFKRTHSIPIIFLSSSSFTDSICSAAYRLGAADYLCRPVSPEVLLGKTSFFVDIALTIAEQNQVESDLRQQNQDLARQNQTVKEGTRLKSQFLTNMSHELRTPLNAIIGFAEVLNDGLSGRLTRQQKEYVGTILTSSHHLLGLINSILDLAKIESGKSELQVEPINLADLIDEVQTSLRTLAAQKRIRIDSLVDGTLIGIVGDACKVKQILYNYLSNALKFTRDEGGVIIRALPEGPHDFRLEVEDTGIGIAPQDLDRLFVEFQQIGRRQDRKYAGTGLGLALTKRIAEVQGGHVGAHSQPDRGSTFYAVLPRVVQASFPRTGEPRTLPGSPNRRIGAFAQPSLATSDDLDSSAGPPVLIVEDNAVNRQLVTVVLERKGFRVFVVNTAEEAHAVLPQVKPRLILMDMQLPGMDGYDFTRLLKSDPRTSDIIIIAMTASAMKGDRQKALEAGCDAYVAKPIDTRALPEMVVLYLGTATDGGRRTDSVQPLADVPAANLQN